MKVWFEALLEYYLTTHWRRAILNTLNFDKFDSSTLGGVILIFVLTRSSLSWWQKINKRLIFRNNNERNIYIIHVIDIIYYSYKEYFFFSKTGTTLTFSSKSILYNFCLNFSRYFFFLSVLLMSEWQEENILLFWRR